jgi:hypothetical protein
MLAFNHMQRLRSAAEVVGSLVGDGGRREFFEQFAAVDGRPTDGPVVPSAGRGPDIASVPTRIAGSRTVRYGRCSGLDGLFNMVDVVDGSAIAV